MTTDFPKGALNADELRELVDRWYLEVLSLASLEPDVALLRAATLEAEIMLARTKGMRSRD